MLSPVENANTGSLCLKVVSGWEPYMAMADNCSRAAGSLLPCFSWRMWVINPLLTIRPGHRVLLEELHLAPVWVSCSSPSSSEPCLLSCFDLSPGAIKCRCLLPLQRMSVLNVQCLCTSAGMARFLHVFSNTSGLKRHS